MTTKLTLTLDDTVIKRAKEYAKKNGTSLSRMVEQYFAHISREGSSGSRLTRIPPITTDLSGMISGGGNKTDKELLAEALENRFLK